ncbi:hypothetical protein PUN28_019067 [Cardiocondyla obscurior]|uniref:Uncharacterized protein n=1 Tax=Cardiocondyla obscurior TaxID=286306 RepID=A0AAW2EH05_9HYME
MRRLSAKYFVARLFFSLKQKEKDRERESSITEVLIPPRDSCSRTRTRPPVELPRNFPRASPGKSPLRAGVSQILENILRDDFRGAKRDLSENYRLGGFKMHEKPRPPLYNNISPRGRIITAFRPLHPSPCYVGVSSRHRGRSGIPRDNVTVQFIIPHRRCHCDRSVISWWRKTTGPRLYLYNCGHLLTVICTRCKKYRKPRDRSQILKLRNIRSFRIQILCIPYKSKLEMNSKEVRKLFATRPACNFRRPFCKMRLIPNREDRPGQGGLSFAIAIIEPALRYREDIRGWLALVVVALNIRCIDGAFLADNIYEGRKVVRYNPILSRK